MGVRSTKAVDGLVRISDEKDAFALLGEFLNQLVLDFVNILKLVHQQIGKRAPSPLIQT